MSNFGIAYNMAKSRNRVIDLRKLRAGAEARAVRARNLAPRHKTSLHARRQKLRALAVLFLLVIVGAMLWGVSQLSYSSKLAINGVSIVGTRNVPAPLVRAYVETKLYDGTYPILSNKNIFLYPRAGIEESISEYFPRIRTARISRDGLLAQAIIVNIAERQPTALWCAGDISAFRNSKDCYLMDDSGFIFAPSTTSSQESFLIFGGNLSVSSSPIGETFLPAHISGVLELQTLLKKAGYAPVGIYAENEQDFSVQFKEGFTLRALFDSDADTLVRDLQLALSSDSLKGKENRLEYIDLRFGNRLYYKNRQ